MNTAAELTVGARATDDRQTGARRPFVRRQLLGASICQGALELSDATALRSCGVDVQRGNTRK